MSRKTALWGLVACMVWSGLGEAQTDGKIAYCIAKLGANPSFFDLTGIHIMDADGANGVTLLEDQELLPNLSSTGEEPYRISWSPDGSKLALPLVEGNAWDIFTLDVNSGERINLTNNAAGDRDPAWSPDGSKIAFSSNRDTGWNIYIMDATGGVPVQLTALASFDQDPTWSPDGSKIAFSSRREGNKDDIYIMDATGGEPVRLTDSPMAARYPAWSPDGGKIVYSSKTGRREFDLYVMDADGGNPGQLTDGPEALSPYWSPDGTRIIFSTGFGLTMVDADGGNLVQLPRISSIALALFPTWSTVPEGETLVYTMSWGTIKALLSH